MNRLRERVQADLDAGRPERAWDRAAEATQRGGLQERTYGRQLLRILASSLPAAAWTEARARAATRAGLTPPAPTARIGKLSFPAVNGQGEGRFVEVIVTPIEAREDRIPPLEPATQTAIRRALDGARATLDQPEARFSVSFDDETSWSGPSAGLAVALAACSAARRTPVSPLWSATGEVDARGSARSVGFIQEKLLLRQAARPRAMLLVPEVDDPDYPAAQPTGSLTDALARLFPELEEGVRDAIDAVQRLDRAGDWVGAARQARLILEDEARAPQLEDEERVELLMLVLLAANHGAETAEQDHWSRLLMNEAALLEPEMGAAPLARAVGSRVVHRVDALDAAGAEEALALARGRSWRRDSRVHLLGPEALLATLRGEHARALALRQRSLEEAPRDERPRCLGDLADALLRLGRAGEALERLAEALELARQRHGYLQQTAGYLHLHRARALAALGRDGRASLEQARSTRGLDPWLRATLLAAELDGDLDAIARLERDPRLGAPRAPLIQALLDRSRARLGDGEAEGRLLAMAPFRGLDLDEAGRRLPY